MDEDVEVYAIHFEEKRTTFAVIPRPGYDGFVLVDESECEIVDPTLYDHFLYKWRSKTSRLLVHWAAEDGGLISGLFDHDVLAMREFADRLKKKFVSSNGKNASPPLDIIKSSASAPKYLEHVEGYFLCPNCCEASEKKNVYDEAIVCGECGTLFNI